MEAAGRLPVDLHDTSMDFVSPVSKVSKPKGIMLGITEKEH